MKLASPTARRLAGRVLRAAQGSAIMLTDQERRACVDALTTPFLTVPLRARLLDLWRSVGADVARHDGAQETQEDRALNAAAGVG